MHLKNSKIIYALTFTLYVALGWSLWPASSANAQTFSCSTVTEIPAAECQALVALYNSTNGGSWKNNAAWLTSNTPCSWYGVKECQNGHVTHLDLQVNNLNGTLPAELGNLTSLQILSLSTNNLVGSLPTELGNLRNLRGLGLANTQLSGALPNSLTNLTHLQEFYFNNSNLCQPDNAAFTAWLNNIGGSRTGISCRPQPTPRPPIIAEDEPIIGLYGVKNILYNGNFEFGFYGLPNLGFDVADWSGNEDTTIVGLDEQMFRPDYTFFGSAVPSNWNWFKNDRAHGKYRIYNNEEFGLICPDDLNQNSTDGKNSLSLHIQSTDEPNARLGIYQTVKVTPGQAYLFVISGTIESQEGEFPNSTQGVMLAFDQAGGQNWQAIPESDWIMPLWKNYRLEYIRSGPNDPDIAEIQDYMTTLRAKSDKLTVFISVMRQLPDWKEVRYTFDCASLIPLNKINDKADVVKTLSDFSTTGVDDALGSPPANLAPEIITAAQPANGAAVSPPAALPISGKDKQVATELKAKPVAKPIEIPSSGGVPTQKNRGLIIALAVVVIIGLVGVGVWNMRRKKQNEDG